MNEHEMFQNHENESISYWGPPKSSDDCIFFWGHSGNTNTVGKECLSQWYPCEFVDTRGIVYKNAEQFMMAYKAMLFGDTHVLKKIMESPDPKEIKSLGRQIKGYKDEQWKLARFDAVEQGNIFKFSQNEKLKDYLISTGDKHIVEASPYDNIWGIGLDQKSAVRTDPSQWPGLNLLGIALMNTRNHIKNES